MKTISFVSYWVLSAAAACLGCSGGSTPANGSLELTLSAPRHCGGNIANAPQCPDGFECVPDPDSHLPFGDVGGICQLASDDSTDDDAPQRCGGNIANAPQCPDGFECVPDPDSHLPFGDVGGICQLASDDSTDDDAPQRCGGNIANAPQCPDGFECVPDPNSHLPFGDVGGICQLATAEGDSSEHGCGSDGPSH